MTKYKGRNKSQSNRGTNSNDGFTAKSGATLHSNYNSDKGFFVSAWKVVDGAMCNIKIFISEKQHAKGYTEGKESGIKWIGCTMVLSKPSYADVILNGMLNLDNSKSYFKDWNWMCNPKAPNDGYIGKHLSK